MSLSEQEYQKFLDGCKPYSKQYAEFWVKLIESFGFVKKGEFHAWCSGINFTHNGKNYTARLCPHAYKGIWFSGNEFRKKCMSENGFKNFLKREKLGVFAP